jgi:hypothetical protein
MFKVYDNGRPADCHHHDVDNSWETAEFQTLAEAQEYAKNWCGDYWPAYDFNLQVGKPIDYSGHGDYIEIREVITV